MLKHRTTVAALAVLTLAACGTENTQKSTEKGAGAGSGDGGITGVHWNVDTLTTDGQTLRAPAGTYVQLDNKGHATGTYGCNHFRADATLKGDTLTLGNGEATAMGCAPDVTAFETALAKTFDGKLTVHRKDGELTLTTAGGDTVTLTSKPVEPPAPLTGTKWTVTTLTSGDTASSLPRGTEGKAYFTVADDGSVRGALGCNRLSGTARKAAATLTFGRMSTTRMMCRTPAMELERQLMKVLRGQVNYAVDSAGLTLTGPDGRGLKATPSGA
ncbi:META domain-containing protein [Streptomyces sp. NPDC050738]|uniref:META domain-containing protein n=1 Tax=Streptomyces sp. NPDC050738 TaxID=3154744 RepID=UPI003414B549